MVLRRSVPPERGGIDRVQQGPWHQMGTEVPGAHAELGHHPPLLRPLFVEERAFQGARHPAGHRLAPGVGVHGRTRHGGPGNLLLRHHVVPARTGDTLPWVHQAIVEGGQRRGQGVPRRHGQVRRGNHVVPNPCLPVPTTGHCNAPSS